MSVKTVHKLAVDIMDLVAGYEDRNSLLIHIFNICSQIQTAIAPLLERPTLNHNTEYCLLSLTPIIQATHMHVEMWTQRHSHSLLSAYNPWLLAHKLKEHKRRLLDQYIILMASLQVVDRIRGYNFVSPAVSVYSFQVPGEVLHRRSPANVFQSSEARTFWKHYFKDEPDSVDASTFRGALSDWLHKELDENSYRRLLLRLDQDHKNVVEFSTLREFVRNGKMADIINAYLADPRLPLLIWIDAAVEENSARVFEAITYGVTVVQLASVGSAKKWVAANLDFLLHNNRPESIRFIVNQTCDDVDAKGKSFTNHNAGHDLLQYIRQQGITSAPVLIMTSPKDIKLTQYVEQDDMAGSTVSTSSVYQTYVAALGAGKTGENAWKKFNAV